MVFEPCCQWRVTGGQPWNPTQAKIRLEGGTQPSFTDQDFRLVEQERPKHVTGRADDVLMTI
jgi:hypothetical protein